MRTFLRVVLGVAITLALLLVGGFVSLRILLDRTREFRAQAQLGKPIVRAIEQYKQDSGAYPSALSALVPTYLASIPEIPDEAEGELEGWDYRTQTNGTAVTYSLSYYMGRGGVEYEAPVWVGNDEGRRKVLFKNE